MISLLSRFLGRLAPFVPGGFNVRPVIHRWRGAKIGKHVWISQYVYLDELHPEGITIGDNCTIGLRTSIFTHFYWGPRRAQNGYEKVSIGNNTFIGPHCVIMPGVKVGEGCVIKAGTVLTRDVPDRAFWGNPSPGPLAEVTVPLTPEFSYDQFLKGLRPFRKAPNGKATGAD